MGQALKFCRECGNKRGCDDCQDLHEWIMERLEADCKPMTLSAVMNMIFTDCGYLTVSCFETEEARDDYRIDPKNGGLALEFRSPFRCGVFLNERFANAVVEQIYPTGNCSVDLVLSLEGE